jgi:hypothetical protein
MTGLGSFCVCVAKRRLERSCKGMSVIVLLSGRGICDGPITRAEESYRVCVRLSVIRCNSKPLHVEGLGRKRSA